MTKRYKKQMDETSNSSVYKKAKKRHVCIETGKCSICPMHGGENASRKGKYGVTKPRKKDKR